MFKRLASTWRAFKAGKPGERFRAARRRRKSEKPSRLATGLHVGLGILLIAVGLVALVTPGPGGLVAIIGAALIARESMAMASVLDRLELWLRKVLRACKRKWRTFGLPAKAALVTLASGLTGAALYGAWIYTSG